MHDRRKSGWLGGVNLLPVSSIEGEIGLSQLDWLLHMSMSVNVYEWEHGKDGARLQKRQHSLVSRVRGRAYLLGPFREAGSAMRADCVVAGRIPLLVTVRSHPQVLEGKLGSLANHALRVGKHQRIWCAYQLVCYWLACRKFHLLGLQEDQREESSHQRS